MIRGLSNIGNNSGGQSSDKSFAEKVKDYWTSIPLFVKIIITTTFFTYMLSWVVNLNFLLNIPAYTIYKFRLWTILTSVLVTPSIINIIFAFMSWIPSGIRNEVEEGTVQYCLNFFIHSIIIQTMFILIMIVIGFIFPSLLNNPSAGLWPYIIGKLTIMCLKNPENQMMFFFFPWPIKAKYYPWVLIGFFTILNFSIQFDLVAAILYGYAYHYKIGSKLELSVSFIQAREDGFPFKYFKNFSGFIPLTSAEGSVGFTAAMSNNNNTNTNSNSNKDDYGVRMI